MKRPAASIGLFALALLLLAGPCLARSELQIAIPRRDARASLSEGCPRPGRSLATRIESPGRVLQGPDALGGRGDYLLMNERAAFVIEGLERINSYYYYGGIPIDAVAMDGCAQAGPEEFEELGLFIGSLNKTNLVDVTVRAFRGERIELRSDGSDGGPAVVRVYGTDDIFWIVELQLMRASFEGLGTPKPRSRPLGLELYVDYILYPDEPVLRIELHLQNLEPVAKHLFTAVGGFFGDATENRFYSEGGISSEYFPISYGLPALVSSSGEGAWAVQLEDGAMGYANISGFNAMFGQGQLRRRLRLAPAGKPGDAATVVHHFAVGKSDFHSALINLAGHTPPPLPGLGARLSPFSGFVTDLATGQPLPGAQVELQTKNRKGDWTFVDGFVSSRAGTFEGIVARKDRDYRLVATLPGRTEPTPVVFNGAESARLEVGFEPAGRLEYEVRDETGRGLPAKITLFKDGKDGKPAQTIYCRTGAGAAAVVPGDYEVSVTRGFEYVPSEQSLTIEPSQTARLEAELVHAVDTTGFLSADMHLHAGPSGDNKIGIPDRILTAAAEGLEVAVGTDHEAIVSWRPGLAESGLGEWVAVVTGEEVTATSPEHINAFPFEPRFDLDARGGPVKWQGLDLEQIYAAIRRRGASIIQLNHPLGYLQAIRFDRTTGEARLRRPEYIGLEPDAALWSWDLDSIEYMNGNDRVFRDPLRPKEYGMFEYWMSMVNLGHRVTAVANTDAHDFRAPGSPRTYFPASTDRPAEFKQQELIAAIKQGRALPSAGAFARVLADGRAGMGDTLAITADAVELFVHIEAIPQIDVDHFKVFVNCDQVLDVKVADPHQVVKFSDVVTVPITRDAQIVVVGFGKDRLPRGLVQFDPYGVPRFTTNPIYVDYNADGYEPPGWDGCDYRLP